MPTPPAGTSSELLADRLFKALVGTLNADLPNINLFDETHSIPWDEDSDILKPVEKLTVEELVKQFDTLMGGFNKHLQQEFEKQRITGAEYTKTYVALTQTAMATALQFALGKDQAFWQAAKTQADAITAQNQNELMRINAMLARASYALTKLKLATEDSTFGASNLNVTEAIPAQILLTTEQRKLVSEQMETQRANTLNTRTDGATVVGSVGKQKDLYAEQIISYQKDVKIKTGQIFASLWSAVKTIDDGTSVPDQIGVEVDGTGSFNTFLGSIRTAAGL